MQRSATSVWKGNLQKGTGEISTASRALENIPYSFAKRFGDAPGTNPEEMIAAAHSSCFAMAVSAALTKKGFEPRELDSTATVSLEKQGEVWTITASRLELHAQVPGISTEEFQAIAADAKASCPVSKLLKAEITLDAYLEQAGEYRQQMQ